MLSLTLVAVSAAISMATAMNSLQGPGGLANPKMLLPMGFKLISQSATPHFCSVKVYTALVLPEEPVHPNVGNQGNNDAPVSTGTDGTVSGAMPPIDQTTQPFITNSSFSTSQNPGVVGVDGLSGQTSTYNQTSTKKSKDFSKTAGTKGTKPGKKSFALSLQAL